jgi:hypothetical protein
MTLAALQDIVWHDLPLRKRIVGRRVVDDLVQLAIESWPVDYINHAATDAERRIVCLEVERSVKRIYTACGPADSLTMGILWTFVLQALVSLIVERILRWWQESRAHRVILVTMRSELMP